MSNEQKQVAANVANTERVEKSKNVLFQLIDTQEGWETFWIFVQYAARSLADNRAKRDAGEQH